MTSQEAYCITYGYEAAAVKLQSIPLLAGSAKTFLSFSQCFSSHESVYWHRVLIYLAMPCTHCRAHKLQQLVKYLVRYTVEPPIIHTFIQRTSVCDPNHSFPKLSMHYNPLRSEHLSIKDSIYLPQGVLHVARGSTSTVVY